MMQIITGLSPTAHADLVAFCAATLAPGFEAAGYADGLIDAADFSDGAHFEIRGLHARSGSPATIGFGDADLLFAEIDENGETVAA